MYTSKATVYCSQVSE